MKRCVFILTWTLLLVTLSVLAQDKKKDAINTHDKGGTKQARIERRTPVVDLISVGPNENYVAWTLDKNEGSGFEIKFIGEDPLVGEKHLTDVSTLTCQIKDSVPRGKQLHFKYRIILKRTGEEARNKNAEKAMTKADSPPEMVIE
jgi:hypothetical protein